MSPFGSVHRTGRGVVASAAVTLAVLALVPGCGSTSSGASAASDPPPAAAASDANGPAGPNEPGSANKPGSPNGSGAPAASDGGAQASRAPGAPQAVAAVKGFYERYAEDPTGASERYLTGDLAARVKGRSSAVFCSGKAPTSMSYAEPEMADGAANVVVTARGKGAPERRIKVTVTVPDILISAITCLSA